MTESRKTNPILTALLALSLLGSMVALFVVLFTAGSDGKKAIQAYISEVQAGASVAPEVAGAEAEALTQTLRQTTSLSLSNFQSQAGTSCFWVSLNSKEARFVLTERGDSLQVTAASLQRECDCPIDSDLACHLQ